MLRRRSAAGRADRRDPPLPRHRRSPCQGRQQGQLQAAQRHAGGCAYFAAGLLRRRAAILHRLEEPQRDAAPARAEEGLHPQRVRPVHPGEQQARRRHNRRRDLRQAGARLHPAGAARELRRDRSGRQTHAAQAGGTWRHPRRSAHAYRRDRWPLHHRGDGPGRQGARLPIHRNHRPLQEPGLCQRARRRARRAAHQANSRRQRRD